MTLQLYDHGEATHRKGACCAGRDIDDARAVADRLGIPHYVLDYESRFKAAVIDRFAEAYLAGETPIPCVDCNQRVKFRDLLATARDLGADVLATGPLCRQPGRRRVAAACIRPRDDERDQSYFMFATTRGQLDMLRFPLGEMTKAQTREAAARFGLAIADKPDSQDICFVPSGRYAEVIERLKPGAAAPGDIVHVDGRVLGRHHGVIHFTIGQRKGLGIAVGRAALRRCVSTPPGPRSWSARARRWRRAASPCATSTGSATTSLDALPEGGLDIAVRVRSSRPPVPARLSIERGRRADRARRSRKTAYRRGRPPSSMTERRPGPASSVAASSGRAARRAARPRTRARGRGHGAIAPDPVLRRILRRDRPTHGSHSAIFARRRLRL